MIDTKQKQKEKEKRLISTNKKVLSSTRKVRSHRIQKENVDPNTSEKKKDVKGNMLFGIRSFDYRKIEATAEKEKKVAEKNFRA